MSDHNDEVAERWAKLDHEQFIGNVRSIAGLLVSHYDTVLEANLATILAEAVNRIEALSNPTETQDTAPIAIECCRHQGHGKVIHAIKEYRGRVDSDFKGARNAIYRAYKVLGWDWPMRMDCPA